REKLPDDFGLAESNYRFGHLDAVVPRAELRPTIAKLMRFFAHAGGGRAETARATEQAQEHRFAARRASVRRAGQAAAPARPDRARGDGRGDLALRRARAPRRAPVHARLRRATLRRLLRTARRSLPCRQPTGAPPPAR